MGNYIEELTLDVLERKKQRVSVLKSLSVQEFIELIIQEYKDEEKGSKYLPYMMPDRLDRYALYLKQGGSEVKLDKHTRMGWRIRDYAHMLLKQEECPEAERPEHPSFTSLEAGAYIRERTSGVVFPIDWQPAIIGRDERYKPGEELPKKDPLAVNLWFLLYQSQEIGKQELERVSSQVGSITQLTDGRFNYTQIASPNRTPTLINNESDYLKEDEDVLIEDGSFIKLARTKIILDFLLPNESV